MFFPLKVHLEDRLLQTKICEHVVLQPRSQGSPHPQAREKTLGTRLVVLSNIVSRFLIILCPELVEG